MTHAQIVEKTIEWFLHEPRSEDATAYEKLCEAGLATNEAEEGVAFVPMAFARTLLEPEGVTFPAYYLLVNRDTGRTRRYKLEDQPVYCAARQMSKGLPSGENKRRIFEVVAGRSAEFNAVNRLLEQGSQVKDISLVPTAVLTKQEIQRPWWQFWGR